MGQDEGLVSFKKDYRIPKTVQEKCDSVGEVHDYLNETYRGDVGVQFNHVTDEQERLWCYENYEQIMSEEVSGGEKVKALQLLLRTECMEQFM